MPATDFPTPPLLATMARTETTAWLLAFGMPKTTADLTRFAEAVACMAGTAYHMAGRARMAERRDGRGSLADRSAAGWG